MESALIISSSEKSISYLTNMLEQASVSRISSVATAGAARRLLIENDYDLCMINAPLTDEPGDNLAANIAFKGISEVILFVKSEIYDEISNKVEDYGIIVISKPISRAMLWSALKIAQATHKRLKSIQSENKKLLQRIEDIRTIDRAKCMLISVLSMTEPEAHKYIEKQAMDMRVTRRIIAEKILKTYEN